MPRKSVNRKSGNYAMRLNVSVPIRERRQTQDGRGHEWVTVGMRTADVEVTVNPDGLIEIARAALRNTSRTSRDGCVTARVFKSTIQERKAGD